MVRNKNSLLGDICIWVTSTIPSTGPVVGEGVGEGVRERKEEGRQRRQWEETQESEEYQYGLIGMPAN